MSKAGAFKEPPTPSQVQEALRSTTGGYAIDYIKMHGIWALEVVQSLSYEAFHDPLDYFRVALLAESMGRSDIAFRMTEQYKPYFFSLDYEWRGYLLKTAASNGYIHVVTKIINEIHISHFAHTDYFQAVLFAESFGHNDLALMMLDKMIHNPRFNYPAALEEAINYNSYHVTFRIINAMSFVGAYISPYLYLKAALLAKSRGNNSISSLAVDRIRSINPMAEIDAHPMTLGSDGRTVLTSVLELNTANSETTALIIIRNIKATHLISDSEKYRYFASQSQLTGNTALIEAIQCGYKQVALELVEAMHPTSLAVEGKYGTALMLATMPIYYDREIALALVNKMLPKDPAIFMNIAKNGCVDTVLAWIDLVPTLAAKEVLMSIIKSDIVAAELIALKLINKIVERKPEGPNFTGRDALVLIEAIKHGFKQITLKLVDVMSPEDLGIKDTSNVTAMIYAAKAGSDDMKTKEKMMQYQEMAIAVAARTQSKDVNFSVEVSKKILLWAVQSGNNNAISNLLKTLNPFVDERNRSYLLSKAQDREMVVILFAITSQSPPSTVIYRIEEICGFDRLQDRHKQAIARYLEQINKSGKTNLDEFMSSLSSPQGVMHVIFEFGSEFSRKYMKEINEYLNLFSGGMSNYDRILLDRNAELIGKVNFIKSEAVYEGFIQAAGRGEVGFAGEDIGLGKLVLMRAAASGDSIATANLLAVVNDYLTRDEEDSLFEAAMDKVMLNILMAIDSSLSPPDVMREIFRFSLEQGVECTPEHKKEIIKYLNPESESWPNYIDILLSGDEELIAKVDSLIGFSTVVSEDVSLRAAGGGAVSVVAASTSLWQSRVRPQPQLSGSGYIAASLEVFPDSQKWQSAVGNSSCSPDLGPRK